MTVGTARHVPEVLKTFLVLGLTSFGGPIAHLGYFRSELVHRRKWLTEADYADLVALCQFLPGPASSQVGFALGLQRGGPLGALAAWAAFTLPSAALLLLFSYSAAALQGQLGQGLIHGLKLVAVAVVAHAVWGMARNLCPDRERATIALAAVLIVVALPTAVGQIGAIILGALAGLWLCKSADGNCSGHLPFNLSRRTGTVCLTAFSLLLVGLPVAVGAVSSQALTLFEAFYRAGALVFGGGHVVLPLLEASTVENGWISADSFLAGYGATQAVPGPLFTFAAYLGSALQIEPNGIVGATLCLIAIFLPGMLLVLGILPYWDSLRRRPKMRTAMAGANAAVVGILGSALYSPVWTGAVFSPLDFALALAAFVLLTVWKAAPWKVVLFTALAGMALAGTGL